MKMLGWFAAIITSILVAWALTRLLKGYRASRYATLAVGSVWLLWTAGLSTLVVGYALTGALFKVQVGLIIAACFTTLFLDRHFYRLKKSRSDLIERSEILANELSELSRQFNATTPPDIPPSRVIKGAKSHRNELLKQMAETKDSLIILSGWANDYGINSLTKAKIVYLLEKNVKLTLGWGYQAAKNDAQERSETEKWLQDMQKKYPSNLKLLYFKNHSKALIRDDKEAVIGSFNWLSNSGKSKNDELSLVIKDNETITNLRDAIVLKAAG